MFAAQAFDDCNLREEGGLSWVFLGATVLSGRDFT